MQLCDAQRCNASVTAALAAYTYDQALVQVWPEGKDCRTASADGQSAKLPCWSEGKPTRVQSHLLDMATPSCVFMLHNGWKQSCCTQQCTARHDVLKKLPAQARQVVKPQQLYKLRSASSGHCVSQACSIRNSHGHAANWYDRCALTLCQ